MTRPATTAAPPPRGLVIIGLALASWWLLLVALGVLSAAFHLVVGA